MNWFTKRKQKQKDDMELIFSILQNHENRLTILQNGVNSIGKTLDEMLGSAPPAPPES